ncbi:hypothetical protein AUJ17_00895 [Candidatus Micrarchaeota archaeon CG1_02_47_40]|nr:MAG: hypothetical protein AUJ17_00895 [Candidatus Micrarchaeota archaeon CG1_02_47_40]
MKCYKHHEEEAVGICTNCGKAICLNCTREKMGKLVCFRCANKVDYEGFKSDRLVSKELLYEFRKWEELHKDEGKGRYAGEKRFGPNEFLGGLSTLMKLVFPHDPRLPVMKEHGVDMIMPILLGGLVAGVLASVPVINLLFFLTVPIGAAAAIAFLRLEGYFQYRISEAEGLKVGILSGIAAAIVSIFIAATFATFFAENTFLILNGTFPNIPTQEMEGMMKIVGLNRHLSLDGIIEMFSINLVLFSFFGGAGGLFFAEKMK